MLDNKTIPEKISFEEEVRGAIEGYKSLYPLDSSNFFYDNYKRSWNNLRDDLDEHKGLDSRTSYLTIMSAARKDRDELFQRCNKQLIKVEELVNTFIDYLKKYSENLS